MKQIFLVISMFTSLLCYSQADSIWQHEKKLKSGIIDYNIIQTDDGSNYFIEKRINSHGPLNSDGDPLYYINLSKSDKDFKEVWSKEYFITLAAYDVIAVKPIHKEVAIFIGNYQEKTKSYTIDLTRPTEKGSIPKPNTFTHIAEFPRGERRENYFKARFIEGNKGSFLLSDLSGKKNVSYGITYLSPDLKTISSTLINRAQLPESYSVADVKIYQNRLLVLGKEFEDRLSVEGKKQKVFQRYVLSVYKADGQFEGDIPVDKDGKISTAKIIDVGDKLFFVGMYNTYTLRDVPDGIVTAQIDLETNQLVLINDRKIDTGLFPATYLGEKDTSELFKKIPLLSFKNRRRFSNMEKGIEISSVDINPIDNSFIIAAEILQLDEYDEYVYGNYAFGLVGAAMMTGEIIKVYELKTKDIILIQADNTGKINWINVVPKNQQETFMYAKPNGTTYSSFNAGYINGLYHIIYNDNKENTSSTELKKEVAVIWDFKKEGALFSLIVDPANGRIEKKLLTTTANEDAILMPLKSININNSFIVPARAIRPVGKDIFKMAVLNF